MKNFSNFLKINLAMTFLVLIMVSCNKNTQDSKSDSQIETKSQGKSNSKDKWGGSTRDEFIKNVNPVTRKALIEAGYAGKEFELADKLSGCIYDKETEYLEKTYGNKVEEGVNYRDFYLPERMVGEFLVKCMREMKLRVPTN